MEENSQEGSKKYAADISSITEAQARISSFIHKTPIFTSETLDSIAGRKLLFKCECFQKGGAFKFRGACNAVFSLDDDQASKGVVTHSRFTLLYISLTIMSPSVYLGFQNNKNLDLI